MYHFFVIKTNKKSDLLTKISNFRRINQTANRSDQVQELPSETKLDTPYQDMQDLDSLDKTWVILPRS